jgi:hypothetical protein
MHKNIFTAKWLKEFEEMVRKEKHQAASSKRGKAQAAGVKRQAGSDTSSKPQAPGAEDPGSGRKHQAS